MTEREKIAQIIAEHLCSQGRAHKALYGAERMCYSRNNFADCEKVSECVDALIGAGYGDVTEWKERAEKAEERLKKLKKTEGDLTVEEEINILENLFEEAKHRSFVFEKELVKYRMAFDKAIKLAYKLRTDLDVLSCSSCEFGYAIDTCKKIGLYDDCEHRWKEELLKQVEHEIEEGKKI